MRDAYREIYESCYMNYSLAAPFVERFFDLSLASEDKVRTGFVGIIVANSFFKRDFRKRLVEDVLPTLDLTDIVDSSGAHIPGHGTPTVLLFGRNRAPSSSSVRVVANLEGERTTPSIPSEGPVWRAIREAACGAAYDASLVQRMVVERSSISAHPVHIGGSDASRVLSAINIAAQKNIGQIIADAGRVMASGYDDFYFIERAPRWMRRARASVDAK